MNIEITKQKKKELEERLHFLETTERDRINIMMTDNKWTESTHKYAQVITEKEAYEKELNELRSILKNCVIIDESKVDYSRVNIGCKVDVIIDNKLISFQIVSSIEANPKENKISFESPIGSYLKRKKVGYEGEFIKGQNVKIMRIY